MDIGGLTTECTECTEWENWKRDQKAVIENQRIIASLYPRNLWTKWHGDWIPCILCNLWLNLRSSNGHDEACPSQLVCFRIRIVFV